MIIAEPVSTEPIKTDRGVMLYHAKKLKPSSKKYNAIKEILSKYPLPFFVNINDLLSRLICTDTPFVIVTDWTDPCELVGLRLETEEGTFDYPSLCFLALYTDWNNIASSGITEIFAHELSHLWLHRLGFDFNLSKSNRFHTCTAITDRFMAFAEGFAEHLEIVTGDMLGTAYDEVYDHGYDDSAWLCNRDSALRTYAVKNNRFLYHTAIPYPEEFENYQKLHMAHIASSAFTPEKLKNGLQAVSSEGLIASFFYRMYRGKTIMNAPASPRVYESFGVKFEGLDNLTNLYIKILYALTKIDLCKPSLFTDFVAAYSALYPNESDEVLQTFLMVTNYVTVDSEAQAVFGELYREGRAGNIDNVRAAYKKAQSYKDTQSTRLYEGDLALDSAIYTSVWAKGDKEICPVPWVPGRMERLKFDVNAATAIDYYSIKGMSFDQCVQLERHRDNIKGFRNLDDFYQAVHSFSNGKAKLNP